MSRLPSYRCRTKTHYSTRPACYWTTIGTEANKLESGCMAATCPRPPTPSYHRRLFNRFNIKRVHTDTIRSDRCCSRCCRFLLSISGGRHLLRHPVCQHCQSLFATALSSSSSSFFNCNSFLYILMIYSASCTCIFFFAVTTSTVGFLEWMTTPAVAVSRLAIVSKRKKVAQSRCVPSFSLPFSSLPTCECLSVW